ncbi:hypothetical protein CDD80_3733 [Ophiocordyceps camponoti-rufipedis]|uniref:SUN domain-containing protein n=1 Tax=Ophiocordyceps camponoti-rufipedis TaxID=2004952 RepID=A0A2C5Z1M3_9HYPO|nr:hypothetical protein CDD80_3733 [Ophiocordyceps camponoti-rufipedis]
MKINYTLAATLAVGVTAFRHNHHHRHHFRRAVAPEAHNANANNVDVGTNGRGALEYDKLDADEFELDFDGFELDVDGHEPDGKTGFEDDPKGKGKPVVRYRPGFEYDPNVKMDVKYVLNDKEIPTEEAEQCLAKGECVQVAELPHVVSTPASQQSQAPPSPAPAPVEAIEQEPVENNLVDHGPVNTKPVEKPVEPTVEKPAPKPTPAPPPSPPPVPKSGLGKCSDFPGPEHGVVSLPWLKEGPWSSIQRVKEYNTGMKLLDIVEQSPKCEPGCMCAYACKPGYAETQWPQAHGSKKESIGGLYCNAEGMLEMTNPRWNELCRPSAANVTIENRLGEEISTCRTTYPGNEAMVIPATAPANGRVALFTPVNTDYISPFDGKTSAHYYVNNAGVGVEDACVWESSKYKDSAGDISPVVTGAGVDADSGIAFLSISKNNKCNSKLNFNIFITGDVVGPECWYVDGNWYGGGTGCTASIKPGGSATFVYTRETSL